MRILDVTANNRNRTFEVRTRQGTYAFPYAKLDIEPGRENPIRDVFPDPEAGCEAFTCILESGEEDSVHLDAVLEYNRDPRFMTELLLYNLTIEVHKAMEESKLSKRELIRRLGTSPSQFYRLLDQTCYGKSVGQMVALLHLLDREVEFVVKASQLREGRQA